MGDEAVTRVAQGGVAGDGETHHPDPSPAPRISRRLVLIVIAVVLAVIGLVAGSVRSFQSPTDSRTVSGSPDLRDGVRIDVNVVKVVPEGDHLIARLAFEPVGSYLESGHFLAKPVRVAVVAGGTTVDQNYAAGEMMSPEEVQVALEGDIAEFPIDSYDGTLEVSVWAKDDSSVPSVLFADASVHGYNMTAGDPVSEIDGGNVVTFGVSRSRATLFFGVFILTLMWALTTLAVVMAAAEIRSGGKMEGPLIGFLGVLLFAFPAIRNSVPNSPPLGVLSDFVAYFWCEVILGLTLVTTLVFTVKRRHSSP